MKSKTTATRKIVHIDEDKCNGCGLCVPSCAEGAIRIIDGKARLVADNLCDGLGNCLGTCPQDAIHIEERPADEFDPVAVERHQADAKAEAEENAPAPAAAPASAPMGGCPGRMLRHLSPPPAETNSPAAAGEGEAKSYLAQWPIQLSLLPVQGKLWTAADVLLAADCVAAAMPDFHPKLVAGHMLAIACPKLDDAGAHEAKLAAVFANNDVRSVTVARMEVPCCGGLTALVRSALERSGRGDLTLREVTIGIDGRVMGEKEIEINAVENRAAARQ